MVPVFALPAHRRSEISYFCTLSDATAYSIADVESGFDYSQLARQAQAEQPGLRHVTVIGGAAEFSALGTLYAGGCVVMARRASPDDAFPLIAAERVTLTSLVPPLAMVWLDAAGAANNSRHHDLSSLTLLQVSGAKFTAEVAQHVAGARLFFAAGIRYGRRADQIYPRRRQRTADRLDPGVDDVERG